MKEDYNKCGMKEVGSSFLEGAILSVVGIAALIVVLYGLGVLH